MILKTPKFHLPPGYPLSSDEDAKRYDFIWKRAFKIHKKAHDFKKVPFNPYTHMYEGPSKSLINPIKGRTLISKLQYCDCYERAWRELHNKIPKRP